MRKLLPQCLAVTAFVLSGCGNGPEKPPVIGQAYAGPATLKLRKEIPVSAPVVAIVKHGEPLEIVHRRRKFLKVRTSGGVVGWTEEGVLLSAEDMAALRDLNERAKALPSQGAATTFDMLNVHTQPARLSPSFIQVQTGEKVDVLIHLISPRASPPRKPLVPPVPKKPRAAKKLPESKIPPIAKPTPPGPPPNWLELSKTNLPPEPQPEPQPVPTDDWTLIRTKSGQSGWVLTRRLFMAIPNDVAQYAEGHRITSYFSLGDVQDGDQVKQNWLWTTLGSGAENYDFDSFRVFIWSVRRHRYETAYIERKLKGYFPVQVRPVSLSTGNRNAPTATYPGFSVCVEKEDGHRYRRNFAFIVNVVRSAGEWGCEVQPVPAATPGQSSALDALNRLPRPPEPPPSLLSRLKTRVAELTKRWLH